MSVFTHPLTQDKSVSALIKHNPLITVTRGRLGYQPSEEQAFLQNL